MLRAKINLVKETTEVTILRKTKLIILIESFEHKIVIDETDTTITKPLIDPKETLHFKQEKKYSLILGVFYGGMVEGIFKICVHRQEREKLFHEIHKVSCAIKPEVSLYRKKQKASY